MSTVDIDHQLGHEPGPRGAARSAPRGVASRDSVTPIFRGATTASGVAVAVAMFGLAARARLGLVAGHHATSAPRC